ncbi:hypothetical protein C2845_PM01G09310 [Panicum miliaceum]|uniref:Uncharacterized protein n=1 Tax=Panicum miliaceum TaxID=4540 RepID=A0A3L6TQ48_PANMI|nr:hypothetical protein C2845_PM01G09310 [Panicum miliaceum]
MAGLRPRMHCLDSRVSTRVIVCSAELDAHEPRRRDKVRRLASHVARLAREGAPVDVGRAAFTTVLSSPAPPSPPTSRTSTTAARWSLGGVQGRDRGGRRRAERGGLLPRARAAGPAVPEGAHRERVRQVARHLRQIVRRVQERAAGEPPKNDFLDLLLDYRGAEDGRGFGRQILLSLFTDLFSAGSDTSAATVEWAMAELLQNPSSMAKSRDELAQVMGAKQEIEESDLGKLKYLQAVVPRLHPPALLLLPRQAEAATEVGGYTVPRGARILVNVWAIGQDPELCLWAAGEVRAGEVLGEGDGLSRQGL